METERKMPASTTFHAADRGRITRILILISNDFLFIELLILSFIALFQSRKEKRN